MTLRVLVVVALLAARGGADTGTQKRVAVKAMLERGVLVLTVDTRRTGVVVPPRHASDAQLLLVVDPKDKPLLDDAAITVALTEKGRTTQVVVPWPAVYRAVTADDKQTDWARDAPADLHDNFIDNIEPVITAEPKRAVVEGMLELRQARIYLDARRPHVVVPAAHRTEHDLVLRIGYHLAPPIPDLTIDDFGVTGTLAFKGKPFKVRVPWDAIYGATIEGYARGMEWVADVPDESIDEAQCYPSGHAGTDAEKRRACEKACRRHTATACNNLASLLVKGLGGPADPVRGRTLFEQACPAVAAACGNAGEVSRSGMGVARDYARAFKFYTLGCDHADPTSCGQLAFLVDSGRGTAVNPARGRELYARACKLGEPHSCTNLGLDFAHADNHARARELYAQACTADDAKGCFELGWEYERTTPPEDAPRAVTHYRRGCELGSIAACINLSIRLKALGDTAGSAKALATLCKQPAPDPIEESDLVEPYAKACAAHD